MGNIVKKAHEKEHMSRKLECYDGCAYLQNSARSRNKRIKVTTKEKMLLKMYGRVMRRLCRKEGWRWKQKDEEMKAKHEAVGQRECKSQ